MSQDSCGYTAIVSAILAGNTEEQLYKLLTETDPSISQKKDSQGRYPLQRALEQRCSDANIIRLLCTTPQTVTEGYKYGINALLLSLNQSPVNPDIIRTILQQAPETARATDRYKFRIPLDLCYERYIWATHTMEHDQQYNRRGGISSTESVDEVERWWAVLVMILELVTATTGHDEGWCERSILRAALRTGAPSRVVQTILQKYPLQMYKKDSFGRYPLHLSCMNVDTKKRHDGKDDVLNLILRSHPDAAKVRDDDGRFALNLLTETGGVSPALMNRLIRANPAAVGEIDRKYNLYPFLVVAAQDCGEGGSSKFRDAEKCFERATVSVIYALIRTRPDLLRSCSGC